MTLSARQALVKLDIDSRHAPDMWTLTKKADRAGVRIEWLRQSRSPSGRGWHLVLSVLPRPRSAMEVVALQAVMGGDLWREAMQVQRARMFPKAPRFMRDAWNVLYQPDSRRARRMKW